jgi:hypothetical protein
MTLNISPGEPILLRFDATDVRKSQLYQILPDDLIAIEQPQPRIEKTNWNRIVLFTYRAPQENGRCGFECRIQETTEDFRVILHKLNDPSPCDLRLWPRIRLDLLPNVQAFCHDKETQVIDISGGGTHIILQNGDCAATEIGSIVNLKFIFDKGDVAVEGEILRKWKDSCQRDNVAIKFRGDCNIARFIY